MKQTNRLKRYTSLKNLVLKQWIIATTSPGMATGYSPNGHSKSFEKAIFQ
jgi:hypothetical protein